MNSRTDVCLYIVDNKVELRYFAADRTEYRRTLDMDLADGLYLARLSAAQEELVRDADAGVIEAYVAPAVQEAAPVEAAVAPVEVVAPGKKGKKTAVVVEPVTEDKKESE